MASPITDEQKQLFLDAYSVTGLKNKACKHAGFSPASLRTLMERDPQFREAFEEAREDAVEVLEDAAWQRAVHGNEETRFDKEGNTIGTRTVFSDGLLTTLLKANAPDKYRERTSTEISGPGGQPIEINEATAAARMAAMLEAAKNRRDGEPDPDPFS